MIRLSMPAPNYSAKICVLCGDLFLPNYPRLIRCQKCRIDKCVECGTVLNTNIKRLLIKPRKCIACHPVPIGTRRIRRDGYVSVKTGDGFELEHRVVMSTALGRPLTSYEIVHHKDENKQHNEIGNLELCSTRDHLHVLHSHPARKLNEEKVLQIHSLAGTMSQRAIGLRVGISNSVVNRVLNGKAWITKTRTGEQEN